MPEPVPTYNITHERPKIQNFSNLEQIQTRRLATSFGGLHSFVAQSAGKLRRCKVMQKAWLTWESISYTGSQRVNDLFCLPL